MIGEVVATTSVACGADDAVRMLTTPLKPVPNAAARGPTLPLAATNATTARARMATARLKRAGAGVALRRASRPRYWRTRYGSGVLIRPGSGGRPHDGGRGPAGGARPPPAGLPPSRPPGEARSAARIR